MSAGQGRSTGQGKGLAQVLTPVKSDYWKNKSALALKEKDAQAKSFAGIGSTPVWSPDTGEFKQKMGDLRSFYRQNQQKILEGDFDTKLELDRLKSDAIQYAKNSNEAGEAWIKNQAMIDKKDTDFSKKSIEEHNKYGETSMSGRGKYQLRQRFDSGDFIKKLGTAVAGLGVDYDDILTETLPDGTKIIVNRAGVKNEDLSNLIGGWQQTALDEYPEQAKEYFANNDIAAAVSGFAKEKQSFQTKRDAWTSLSGQEKLNKAQRRKEMLFNIMNNTGELDNEIGHLLNKSHNKYGILQSVEHNTTDYPTGTVVFTYNHPKNGETVLPISTQEEGAYTKINSLISGLGGMQNIDDNALSLVPDYKPAYPVEKAEKSEVTFKQKDLLGILSLNDIPELGSAERDDLVKSVKNPELKKSILNAENLEQVLEENVVGKDLGLGVIESISNNFELLGKNGWDVKINGKEFFLGKDDVSGLRYLLGMPYDKASAARPGKKGSEFIKTIKSESGKKSVSSKSKSGRSQEAKDKARAKAVKKAKLELDPNSPLKED
ncbi:hypothetical protein N9924_00070 [bacterium]|nr:hypothetical protein [bacterium]